MHSLAVVTTLHAAPDAVFDVLADFESYPQYTEYLTAASRLEAGDPDDVGALFGMRFSWWRITYTARSRVTAVERPARIEWELVGGPTATGVWRVEPVEPERESADGHGDDGGADDRHADAPDDAGDPPPTAPSSRVVCAIRYDPTSVSAGDLGLPRLVSLDWVVEKARPLVEEEAVGVLERVARDIEGEPRAVDVSVESGERAARWLEGELDSVDPD